MTVTFTCQRCGECCHSFLKSHGNGVHGLNLQADETHLFPKEHVKPLYAVGKGRRRPRRGETITYQLDLDRCPHYTDDKKCAIYNKRPNVCRSFPFALEVASGNCPVIKQQVPDNKPFVLETGGLKSEFEAVERHRKYLAPYMDSPLWVYDLDKQDWRKCK